jgi:hypothetical protein
MVSIAGDPAGLLPRPSEWARVYRSGPLGRRAGWSEPQRMGFDAPSE